jgi:hypothetical protein
MFAMFRVLSSLQAKYQRFQGVPCRFPHNTIDRDETAMQDEKQQRPQGVPAAGTVAFSL